MKNMSDEELEALERWATGPGPPLMVGPALVRLIAEVRRLRGALGALLDVLADMSSIQSPDEIADLEVAEERARADLKGDSE